MNFVMSVTSNLGISKDGKLVESIPEDLQRFKSLTSRGNKNAVIMGRKTWDSLPKQLPGRVHIVFTRNKIPNKNDVYFIHSNQFESLYKKLGSDYNFTVIGGGEIAKYFFNGEQKNRPKQLFLTHIKNSRVVPNEFLEGIPECYKMTSFTLNTQTYKTIDSQIHTLDKPIEYNYLNYERVPGFKTDENGYLNLLSKVLEQGTQRTDRTGTGTMSTFGEQMRFDISDSFPLLTTKRVPFKGMVEELLWFLRGDTDANILKERGVKIWDGNTSREFLDSRGLDYPTGTLGPGYGWSMRFYGAEYNTKFSDTKNGTPTGGVDQIEYILDLLRTDPMSRRIYMNYWNPTILDQTALVPCHVSFQLYVTIVKDRKYLSGHLYQRSMDTFLGAPWNIASYSLLIYILAAKTGMYPKDLVISTGDTHIYTNHFEQVKTQLSRSPRPFPKVQLHESIANKNFRDMTFDDFKLIGYFPHSTISGKMAI